MRRKPLLTLLLLVSALWAVDSVALDSPGADLLAVSAEAFDGSPLGWANVVALVPGSENNDFSDASFFDGNETNHAAICSNDERAPANTLSLGCGGTLLVEFRNPIAATGNVAITGTDQVHVVEYGTQCMDGSDADTFAVFLCSDEAAARAGDLGSCTENIGSGSGDLVAQVILPTANDAELALIRDQTTGAGCAETVGPPAGNNGTTNNGTTNNGTTNNGTTNNGANNGAANNGVANNGAANNGAANNGGANNGADCPLGSYGCPCTAGDGCDAALRCYVDEDICFDEGGPPAEVEEEGCCTTVGSRKSTPWLLILGLAAALLARRRTAI